MSRKSRRNRANKEKIELQRRYSVEEGIALLKTFAPAKFDESVDIALRLGIDAKKSDQMVRGACRLPHGTGRKIRILVFAKGEKEQQARDAGADYVGAEDLVEKIKGGWLEFDKAIATPDMMAKVGPIAKILGPRNLMPNPRMGTVTTDPAKAVAEEKAGRVEFRVDKAAIVHVSIGRFSFTAEHLQENFQALLEQIQRAKPQTSKGNYFQALSLATTMGPGIRLDATRLAAGAGKE